MSNREHRPQRRGTPGNVVTGLIIILIGFGLLIHQLNFFWTPRWLFTWQMLLIVLGLAIGARKNFTGIGWFILILVGGFFMVDEYLFYNWSFHSYGWPVIIIIIGVFVLFRTITFSSRHEGRDRNYWRGDSWGKEDQSDDDADEKKNNPGSAEDYVNLTNVFGGNKKRIFSKHFKGGETTNFFGGTELDLTQADIDRLATIDIVQMFGGVKLIVPSNWSVKSDMVTILGGYNDKRSTPAAAEDQNKVLVLTGTCIFGGVEIKSY